MKLKPKFTMAEILMEMSENEWMHMNGDSVK